MLYSDQYRYNEAEVFYRKALADSDRADDAGSRARTLYGLAELHYAQHRYLEAEEVVSETIAISISLGKEDILGGAYLLSADIFESQSKLPEVTDALIQAEGALGLVGQHALRAETLHRLGNIYFQQDIYGEAEVYYRLAQAIFSSMEETRGEAASLLSLGILFGRQGRYDEAEECFAQARTAFATISDEDGEAKALEWLKVVYSVQQKARDGKAACEISSQQRSVDE